MASAVKKVFANLKRKSADAPTTPQATKKTKTTPSNSSRVDSESVSGAPTFDAKVVPATYKPKQSEVLKRFDEIAEEQSLVSQAEGFYKSASRICIDNGHEWDAMHRYKTAVYMGTNFAVGDDVLVMQNETNDEKSGLPTELHGRWLGRIIEIRALDQVNVFILVNWYNRPEDLAKGRAPHHSMNEILATNDVDVIAPTSLVGKIDVDHWIESDETAPPDRTIFWRQCVAMEGPGEAKFSKLKTVCTCGKPANVDKMLINCETCDLWLHDECLVTALVKSEGIPEKKWKRHIEPDANGDLPEVLPPTFKLTPAKGKPWVVELQDEGGMFVSQNRNGERWEEQMKCLKCNTWLK